jgi:hypothetical protein
LGDAAKKLQSTDPDKHLLDCAALLLRYKVFGVSVSPFNGIAAQPAPNEALPAPSERAASLIAQALAPSFRSCLPEALTLLKQYKLRLPFSLLPDLLSAACKDRELIVDLLPVLGNRGIWLAEQNSAWRPIFREGQLLDTTAHDVSLEQITKLWSTQDKEGRLPLLKAIRKQNPEVAVNLLESTWTTDAAAERAAHLSELVTGLSASDEPFLLQALEDKSKEVNKLACRLLSFLPDSELAVKAVEFAHAHVTYKKSFLGGELEMKVPKSFDPAWSRYNIEEASSIQNVGDRSWWLVQWLSLVPPEYWSREFQLPPEKLLALASKTDCSDALWIAWLRAFSVSKDIDWKYAILRKCAFMDERRISVSNQIPSIDELGERAEHLLFELLDSDKEPMHDMHRATRYLSSYSKPWSPELTRRVLRSIYHRIELPVDVSRHTYITMHLLKPMAQRINPAMAAELLYDWPAASLAWPTWRTHILTFEATLGFRNELYKEIKR